MTAPMPIAQALAPVRADLERDHPGLLRFDVQPPEEEMTLLIVDGWGCATGIWRSEPDTPEQAVAQLADQVQEVVVETLPGVGAPASWPICPDHPRTHPLAADVAPDSGQERRAVWRCPVSHRVIAPIGDLPASARGR